MLVFLKKNSRMRYGSVLAKEVDCTYSHAVKILQTLEDLKLVEFEKKGRIKLIKLTKKGADVADFIEQIQSRIRWLATAPERNSEKKLVVNSYFYIKKVFKEKIVKLFMAP